MNNAVFGKTMENVRKHRNIKIVTTIWSKNQIIILKVFTEYLLAIEMKKTEILMKKPVCLGLSILEISKILM